MILVIDIGNTSITAGIFNDDTLVKKFRMNSDAKSQTDKYYEILNTELKGYKIEKCVIGSVVNELTYIIKNITDKILDTDSIIAKAAKCNLKISLKEPETVGIDRIANALALKELYKSPAIAVDIGTAITLDVISSNGEFIGGTISPGINTQLKALNLNTSKLPLLNAASSPNAIGDCTKNAILSGVVRGTTCAIEGLIKQCEKELNEKATIVYTGGMCELVVPYTSIKIDFINPELTLYGLKLFLNQ